MADIAIVLGGIRNHKILIQKLKDRGFYTILVDYLDNPSAKEIADEHVQISTFDLEAIEKLAAERHARVIINACLEHVNVGICKIAEKLGLPHPYSYETALDISDKERMKTKMVDGGVPTTPFICVDKPDDLEGMTLRFPVYVKPADSNGSSGVNRAETLEEAKACVGKAVAFSRKGKVIVEEEAKGGEYDAYCFPQGGKANVLYVVRKYTDNRAGDGIVKGIGTFGPAPLSDAIQEKVTQMADRIVQVFGLDNVPFFIQFMSDGNEVNVIEFAGRMAGGSSYRTVYENTGFDLFEGTINSFLNLPNKVEDCADTKWYFAGTPVYASPCTYDHVGGYEELLESGVLHDIFLYRQPGTELKDSHANGVRVALVLNRAKTAEELLEKIETTFNSIEVYDVNGNPQMKRGLYIRKEIL